MILICSSWSQINYPHYSIWAKIEKEKEVYRIAGWLVVDCQNRDLFVAEALGLYMAYNSYALDAIVRDNVSVDGLIP